MKTALKQSLRSSVAGICALLVTLGVLGLSTAPLRADPATKVVPPSSMKFGNDYAGWSASWWKWFMEFPLTSPSGVTHPAVVALKRPA